MTIGGVHCKWTMGAVRGQRFGFGPSIGTWAGGLQCAPKLVVRMFEKSARKRTHPSHRSSPSAIPHAICFLRVLETSRGDQSP